MVTHCRATSRKENKSAARGCHQRTMHTKKDFSPSDWNVLRDTQYYTGLATLMSAASGLGTIQETIAVARGVIENQTSDIPLIRDLCARNEIDAAQNSVKQRFGGPNATPTPESVRRVAIEKVNVALSVLKPKATPEEIEGYCKMIYRIAERVAAAASEGGFARAEGEQAFLENLRDTLQIEKVKRA